MPDTGSRPMVASQRPMVPASNPLTRAPPLSEATKVMPTRASMKNSGEPNVSTSGRTIGMVRASTRAPNTAPKSELIMAAPRARPASPFLAMAWPSTTVAAVVGSPGIPKRIEVMSPVVLVTAAIPSRNANASTGFILKMNGSMRARVVGPPRPGRMPTANPMTMPMSIRPNAGHAKVWSRPVNAERTKSVKQDGPETRGQGGLDLEELVHHRLDLLAADVVDVELRLLGLAHEGRITQRLLEGLAQDLHAILGRARWQRVGAGDGAVVVDGDLDEAAAFGGLGEVDGERHGGQIGSGTWRGLQHDAHLARIQPLAPGRAHARPAPARAGQLSGLGGEPDVGGALVAGDELDGQPQRERRHPDGVVGGARARNVAAELHGRGGGHPVLQAGDPAGLRESAHHVIPRRRADVLELAGLELDALLSQSLAQQQAADEAAHGEPVGLGHPVQVIGEDQAAGARHVLDHDGGVAGNVTAHVAGERPGVGVEAAPGREADEDAHRLAPVEPLVAHALAAREADRDGEHDHDRDRPRGEPPLPWQAPRVASIPRQSRSGVRGRSLILTPMARASALATAGEVGSSPLSPIPLAP